MELMSRANGKISSLELVEQINIFRGQEGGRAELKHNDLLKIIRDEFEDEIGMGKISHTPYTHPQNGQVYNMFELTMSQAKQVLIRESRFVRKAVIQYIEKLESNQLPTTYIEALKALVQSEESRLMLAQKNEEMKPKADYHDNVLKSVDLVTTTMIAKEFGLSAIKLNNILEGLGIQFKVGGVWVLKQKFAGRGFTKVETTSFEHNSGLAGSSNLTKWTEKGRKFIIETLVKYGYTYKG